MSIGLVFSGGGTCGAYQIGFWRALRECGMENNVSAVSGSSVGSLNALLFAGGDLKLAEDIWRSLKQADLFKLRGFLDKKGFFSQIGYACLIDQLKDRWQQLQKGMPIYSCVSVLDRPEGGLENIDLKLREAGRPEYIRLNGLGYNAMKNVLLASSAIPYVYPHRHVKRMTCIDGDFSDKTPYRPLADSGCDEILILHLNTREEAKGRRLESDEDLDPVSGRPLYHLYPSETLGAFMLVTKELTQRRMQMGFEDGKRFLQDF
ncbi:MAG: patatin-like phospholipase family protein [Lachnospiraceae bacterium]|nr:patatin-like phospholipase family protein [Lachnospiraceae bacterium]